MTQAEPMPSLTATAKETERKDKPTPRGRGRALLIVAILGIALLTGGFLFWRYSETYESTDDAQVDAHLSGIGSRIQGTIVAVYADENQLVKAGQVLAEIDPRDYQVALEQAQAQLGQSRADILAQHPNIPITQITSQTAISTAQADVDNALAALAAAERDVAAANGRLGEAEGQLRQAQANDARAQADLARYKNLVEKDEVSKQQYDQYVAAAKAESAAVEAAQASVQAARESAAGAQKVVDQRRAQLLQAQSKQAEANRNAPQQVAISQANLRSKEAMEKAAQARVDRAQLDLSYTKIVSPVAGYVSKRSAEVGATVQPGQQLFTIAQTDDIWVTANFKETQLRRMRPGQRVDIKVDAFDRTFGGYVESMPAASGAVSSLLPPENATGNFVKVVQRLPVRIRFDKNQKGLELLRPGMSTEPKVWLQ